MKTCPKCRLPLDGDEEYLCCAGLSLTWTCDGCQKVYEGFAFPYGLCPACGGTLAHGHEAALDSAKAVEALRHAFEIELGGLAFYARGAEETTDPVLKELFVHLSTMERGHMETARGGTTCPSRHGRPASAARACTRTPTAGRTGEDLLKLAVHLEKRARRLPGARTELEPGSAEWRLYREMEAEEREHGPAHDGARALHGGLRPRLTPVRRAHAACVQIALERGAATDPQATRRRPYGWWSRPERVPSAALGLQGNTCNGSPRDSQLAARSRPATP